MNWAGDDEEEVKSNATQIGIFEICTGDLFHVHENCAFAKGTDKNFVRLGLITIKIQYVTFGYTFQGKAAG